jgi:hypothetical protein
MMSAKKAMRENFCCSNYPRRETTSSVETPPASTTWRKAEKYFLLTAGCFQPPNPTDWYRKERIQNLAKNALIHLQRETAIFSMPVIGDIKHFYDKRQGRALAGCNTLCFARVPVPVRCAQI